MIRKQLLNAGFFVIAFGMSVQTVPMDLGLFTALQDVVDEHSTALTAFAIGGAVIATPCIYAWATATPVLRWDWTQIPTAQENYLETLRPAFAQAQHSAHGFVWGVGDSAFQTEGPWIYDGKQVENSWTQWQRKVMHEDQYVGNACNRWNLYKEDIARIKECGFTSYRTSIEWSKVNPAPGVFDDRAMQHYVDVVDEALSNGIEPVIMLFHHTWPVWFGDKGGFELAENIQYFVDYANYVFKKLNGKVKIWMTINEPSGYAMQGWFRGEYPPGKKDLTLTGCVYKNLLDAHCAVYKEFKKVDPTVSIGYAKIVQHLDPYHTWHPIERMVSSLFDYLMNNVDIEYFKTGNFVWGFPFKTLFSGVTQDAPQCLDFIGVNYYSHTTITMYLRTSNMIAPGYHPCELIADNGLSIYPEGLYRAVERCSVLGKPMYVAENGIADRTDLLKKDFIRQHLYAVTKLLEDGFDVRGYYYWTLMDNFEWRHGYEQSFGLFSVDFTTQERTLRAGAQEFVDYVRSFNLQ